MKYLGEISDNKDLVTKEYVDGKSGVTGVKGNAESSYRTGNVNITAANVGAVSTSGGTMTGQLKTSFNYSVATGSYGATATTIPSLCEELRYSSGCVGSFYLATAYTKDGVTIPTGWYNFQWIPHRNGGLNGAANGDNCNYGSFYITGMTAQFGRLWLINYSSSAIQKLTEFHSFGSAVSANNISSGYLNTHPENSPVVLPFMNNDIAFLSSIGGSCVIKYDSTVQNIDSTALFDGSPNYWYINPTGITTITMELTFHRLLTYGNVIYVDFGAAGWRAKSVNFEYMNNSSTDWVQLYSVQNNAEGHVYFYYGFSSAGINRLRITFSDWNNATIFRIAQIGVINYASYGLRSPFMSRGIDDLVYRSITPGANATYDLGSSTYKWRNIYGNLTGAVTGHATTAGNVTGTVAVANGGTGQTTAQNAANAFLNALSTGGSTPVDDDYYISQYAGGGTTTTTYHRRPVSVLWEYIKGKISSVLGLTNSQYGGNAATATSATSATNASQVNNHTVNSDVPVNAVFTDTIRNRIYTGTCPTAAGTAEKTVTLEESTGYSLTAGVRVAVRFANGNTAITPTLNVNSSGARGIAYPTSATAVATGNGTTFNSWGAYETVLFTYNGSKWVKDATGLLAYLAYYNADDAKTVAQQAYAAIPAAGTAPILAAGTDTANRAWSAKILHDYIESGVPTTTWLRATITDSTVTFSSGGHYVSGRHCYVQMQLTTANTINANTVTNILSGMPAPTGSLAVLQISIGNKMENYMAQVTTGGVLRIRSAAALSSGATINITGVYTIA